MKTKIKRHSRSVISVVLAVCMLISCMTVGIIATDAAKVDSEQVGSTITNMNFAKIMGLGDDWTTGIDMDKKDDNHYIKTVKLAGGSTHYFKIQLGKTGDGSWNNLFSISGDNDTYYGFHKNWTGPAWSLATNQNNFYLNVDKATSGYVNVTFEFYGSYKDNNVDKSRLTVTQEEANYYLHTSTTDSGMASTTGQLMTDNNDGTYSIVVNNWNSDNLHFNITKSAAATQNTTELDSVTITPSDGVSVSQSLTDWGQYKRVGLALNSKPQNVTFTFNPTAKTLSVAGSEVKVQLTAGGSTSSYTLRISDGSTAVSNSGTTSAQFIKGKTVTVTVTPKNEAEKVTAITNCSSVTNNGDGTYTGTFTVNTADTITATLGTRNKYAVNFSSNNNDYGTVSAKANGNTITSGAQVYEGTKVTFTAAPKNGYALQSWSDSSTAKTVIKTITAATTMSATFIKEGYSVNYGDTNDNKMKMLPNGWYILDSKTTGDAWFVIKRDSDNQYSTSGATVNATKTNAKITAWGNKSFTDGYVLKKDSTPSSGYITFDPETGYVWLSDNTDGYQSISVIAKNGTIRSQDGAVHTSDFGVTTVEDLSETKIANSKISSKYNNKAVVYDLTGADISNGVTLKIKTQTNDTYRNQGYYVKGFAVSGHEETYSVLWQEFDENGDPLSDYQDKDFIDRGYNEFTLTIDSYSGEPIEITPIYFIKEAESGNNVRFYIEDFAGEVKDEWGGTLAIDVYGDNSYRPFGQYPGQPMINYNGRYMMDIPRNGIQGITMNNFIWDRAHADYFYGTMDQSDGDMADSIRDKNHQTYDYNDFVYINKKLTAMQEDEDIIFSFRYKKDEDHDEKTSSNLSDKAWYKDNENYTNGTYANGTVNANDYRNGFNTIDETSDMYQFENLTDFYGQRVDVFGDLIDVEGNTKANYNPIMIVSNGYDRNKAGEYATAWAIYYPEHETGDPGTYTLMDVIGGAGRAAQDWQSQSMLVDPDSEARVRFKYDASVHNDPVWEQLYQTQNNGSTDYPTLIHDLAKYPVKITYEYEVASDKSNYGGTITNYGYRSDGRWYYSNSNQKVTAHTLIEVAEKRGSAYTRDYYQQNGVDYTSENYNPALHTGLTTGIQAYLENDGYEERKGIHFTNTAGNTEAYAITDGEDSFDLFAQGDPDGNYTFDGWYLYNNGNYTLVTRKERYSAEATNNDVYVARYYRTPSGTLNIKHQLTDSSKGEASCYVKVEVLDSSNKVVATLQDFTTDAVKVTPTYMKNTSDNKLRITLKTSLVGITEYEWTKEDIDGDNTLAALAVGGKIASVSAVTTSGNDREITITTTPISSFFTNGEQNVKLLPFFSQTKYPTIKYDITYYYKSRKTIVDGALSNLDENRLWGDQFYKAVGTFTEEQIEEYINLVGPAFKEGKDTEFLQENTPYEENFKEKLKWNYSGVHFATPNKVNDAYTFTTSMTAQQDTNEDINVTLKFPFAYTLDTNNTDKLEATGDTVYTFTPTKTDGKVIYNTETQDKSVGMKFLDWFSLNKIHNIADMNNNNGAEPTLIEAPAVVYNGGSGDAERKRTFKWWELRTEGTNGSDGYVYKKVYSTILNVPFYQNTVLVPVYSDEVTVDTAQQPVVKPTTDKTATITWLQNSRSQWNYEGGGSASKDYGEYDNYGDRLFSDFVLTYEYNNIKLNSVKTPANYEVGILFEKLEDSYTTDVSALITKYQDNDGKSVAKTELGKAELDSKYTKSTFDVTKLDNKNSIEYYYSFANKSQTNAKTNLVAPEGFTTRRDNAYRAYSFIKVGSDVIVSDPVYFTYNDVAFIQNGDDAVIN